MESKDLMIGDWVMVTNLIYNGKKMQVKEIHGDGCITVDGAITKMFEPISLTAEILEKNGFVEFTPDNWQIVIDNIMIELRAPEHNMAIWLDWDEHDTGTYASYMFPRPNCVHELQHTLRLCGIEKEINL